MVCNDGVTMVYNDGTMMVVTMVCAKKGSTTIPKQSAHNIVGADLQDGDKCLPCKLRHTDRQTCADRQRDMCRQTDMCSTL